MKHHRNFIAARRKASGFSSKEFSELLGLASSSFSQLEGGLRRPRFDLILALEVMLGESLGTLYAEGYERHEERVMAVAKIFEEKLRDRTDDRSVLKRRFLEGIAQRARERSDA